MNTQSGWTQVFLQVFIHLEKSPVSLKDKIKDELHRMEQTGVIIRLKQLQRRGLKKIRASIDGIRTRDLRDTGAMLYKLSYEATHWERGQLVEFASPV